MYHVFYRYIIYKYTDIILRWHCPPDTGFNPWRSEHATSRSGRLLLHNVHILLVGVTLKSESVMREPNQNYCSVTTDRHYRVTTHSHIERRETIIVPWFIVKPRMEPNVDFCVPALSGSLGNSSSRHKGSLLPSSQTETSATSGAASIAWEDEGNWTYVVINIHE